MNIFGLKLRAITFSLLKLYKRFILKKKQENNCCFKKNNKIYKKKTHIKKLSKLKLRIKIRNNNYMCESNYLNYY